MIHSNALEQQSEFLSQLYTFEFKLYLSCIYLFKFISWLTSRKNNFWLLFFLIFVNLVRPIESAILNLENLNTFYPIEFQIRQKRSKNPKFCLKHLKSPPFFIVFISAFMVGYNLYFRPLISTYQYQWAVMNLENWEKIKNFAKKPPSSIRHFDF